MVWMFSFKHSPREGHVNYLLAIFFALVCAFVFTKATHTKYVAHTFEQRWPITRTGWDNMPTSTDIQDRRE